MVLFWCIQAVVGVLYAQLLEWVLHKYVLHGIGKEKGAPFSFHFHGHHRASRKQLFFDDHYESSSWGWNPAGKEVYSLFGLAIIHLPVALFLPIAWAAAVLGGVRYFVLHRKAHLDPQWCKEHLPWHYDHHMGPNPDLNWGVTTDLFDRIFGTREVYLGTEREKKETARRLKRFNKVSKKLESEDKKIQGDKKDEVCFA